MKRFAVMQATFLRFLNKYAYKSMHFHINHYKFLLCLKLFFFFFVFVGTCTVRWENKTMYCIVSAFGLAI